MEEDYPVVRGQRVAREKLQQSRILRQTMTDAERVLWKRLRGGQVLGLRFRRQQVIAGFIVDFYCHAAHLVIEVDGNVHVDQTDYDAERHSALSRLGLRTARFNNDDALTRLNQVMASITALCEQTDMLRSQPSSPDSW